jgi:uncharacterized membrane protein
LEQVKQPVVRRDVVVIHLLQVATSQLLLQQVADLDHVTQAPVMALVVLMVIAVDLVVVLARRSMQKLLVLEMLVRIHQ